MAKKRKPATNKNPLIERMRQDTNRETAEEVILDALKLYSEIIARAKLGKKLFSGESLDDPDVVELEINLLKEVGVGKAN